ncbi:hypothetical protein B0I33_104488 [Prauserella shujinwangii]|uniref:Uncharacterized protein n=1 Tax=Prauserella shujinwangii TaxID=1453103 RepID=A0A2T0LXC0_9PSEU|nr:hypothetical protein [Prauserella shujinwangii]PRX48670.1 hypothetical protein B0I33_104488 [Prauserella shujinwangii]
MIVFGDCYPHQTHCDLTNRTEGIVTDHVNRLRDWLRPGHGAVLNLQRKALTLYTSPDEAAQGVTYELAKPADLLDWDRAFRRVAARDACVAAYNNRARRLALHERSHRQELHLWSVEDGAR